MFITHDCVLMNVVYKNFSDMDSKPLTGCITHGNFTLVLKEIIFVVSFQLIIIYGKLYFISTETRGKLTVHFHILSLQLFDQRKSVPQHL